MASDTRAIPSRTADGDETTTTTYQDETDTQGVIQSVIRNPIVSICILYASIGSLMYGFDNISLSLCLSMEPFIEQFGEEISGEYAIPAYWQSLWNALPQLTTGIGAWTSGLIADRFGRRSAFFVAGVISATGIAVVYTAPTRGQFLGGKMVNALGLGLGLATGQTYISEISPLKLRGIALSLYTFCLGVGYLIAASIAFGRITIMNQSAYKVLFASAWCWPIILMLGAFIIPESPFYLVRKSQAEAAGRAVSRLYPRYATVQIHAKLQSIQDVISSEVDVSECKFVDCFKGMHWRRTRIVLYANGLSQMTGATFISNAPYFMVIAGMSSTQVATMIELGIGLSIISSFFTFAGLALFGRRLLVLSGIALAGLLFFIMGVAASVAKQSSASRWCAAVTLQMVWLSIGPANGPALSVAGEVSAVRLRAKTLAIGFFFNYFYSTVWNVVVPYMYDSDEGNLGGLVGWIFFATSLIAFVIMWFELPETKDLTAAQIDERFQMGLSPRKFNRHIERAPSDKELELGQVEQVEDRNAS